MDTGEQARQRLREIRESIQAESVSWGELHELQGLTEFIDPSDVELLEWAGVPEYMDHRAGCAYFHGSEEG